MARLYESPQLADSSLSPQSSGVRRRLLCEGCGGIGPREKAKVNTTCQQQTGTCLYEISACTETCGYLFHSIVRAPSSLRDGLLR